MKTRQYQAISFAILAAALYAISSPVSKLLLQEIPPTLMASFLYLGAGLGMLIMGFISRVNVKRESSLTKKELPFTLTMVVLDILAPIFLMIGLTMTSAANAFIK